MKYVVSPSGTAERPNYNGENVQRIIFLCSFFCLLLLCRVGSLQRAEAQLKTRDLWFPCKCVASLRCEAAVFHPPPLVYVCVGGPSTASTFNFSHPETAWKWRSRWLPFSRELRKSLKPCGLVRKILIEGPLPSEYLNIRSQQATVLCVSYNINHLLKCLKMSAASDTKYTMIKSEVTEGCLVPFHPEASFTFNKTLLILRGDQILLGPGRKRDKQILIRWKKECRRNKKPPIEGFRPLRIRLSWL